MSFPSSAAQISLAKACLDPMEDGPNMRTSMKRQGLAGSPREMIASGSMWMVVTSKLLPGMTAMTSPTILRTAAIFSSLSFADVMR